MILDQNSSHYFKYYLRETYFIIFKFAQIQSQHHQRRWKGSNFLRWAPKPRVKMNYIAFLQWRAECIFLSRRRQQWSLSLISYSTSKKVVFLISLLCSPWFIGSVLKWCCCVINTSRGRPQIKRFNRILIRWMQWCWFHSWQFYWSHPK